MFSILLFIYSIIFYVAIPFLWLRLYLRGRKDPAYRLRFGERLGKVPPAPADISEKIAAGAEVIWVHAVSVGEVRAAVPLVNALLKQHPEKVIMLTCTTATGSKQVEQLFADTVWHSYLPYDAPIYLRRFFSRVKPKLLIILETELWPSLFEYAYKKKVPIFIANARLSLQSTCSYLRVKHFVRPFISKIAQVSAQSEYDACRFHAIGVEPAKVIISGNLKYDMTLPDAFTSEVADLAKLLWPKDSWVWCAGSVHADANQAEFTAILHSHLELLRENPNCKLILVPRHLSKCSQIKKLFEQAGLSVRLRTDLSVAMPLTENVLLVDTMGELLHFYALSQVAFVGGSIVTVGGHNLLEPAALSKPVISGPFLQNFTAISQQMLQADALTIVENTSAFQQALLHFLQSPEDAAAQGKRGQELVERHKGALQRHIKCIDKLLDDCVN